MANNQSSGQDMRPSRQHNSPQGPTISLMSRSNVPAIRSAMNPLGSDLGRILRQRRADRAGLNQNRIERNKNYARRPE